MSLYSKKGLIKRVHKNTFALTDQGIQTVEGAEFDESDDSNDYLRGERKSLPPKLKNSGDQRRTMANIKFRKDQNFN
jgi:hypothetical protein